MKGEKKEPASVFRSVPCAPLKSFKVEAFGVTRKLPEHLAPGGIWEGRKLFKGKAGPPRPPAGRGPGPCFCGATGRFFTLSLLNYKYLSK